MPRIADLPLLSRPVAETDWLLVETPTGTKRIAATAFKGAAGNAQVLRETATITTGLLGLNAQETGLINIARSFEILAVVFSSTARLRLYDTPAAREADLARSIFIPATSGTGLILEINADTDLDINLEPHAHGSEMSDPPTADIAYTLDNLSVNSPVIIEITFIREEQ